ncbi:MAG: pro-sigmaK processing inhibitor BofA family protein [Bacilli bacterium]
MEKVLKVIFQIVKKIVLAFCLVYGFNLIVPGLNIFIPINIITILVVTLLGIPGLLSLVAIFFVLM